MNSILKPDGTQNFLVFAYTKPIIYDGSNWEKRMENQKMNEKGYEIVKSIPADYSFAEDKS